MCCCCGERGHHGWRGHGRGHGHGRWHECGPEEAPPPRDRGHEREECGAPPPPRERGSECECGGEEDAGFNWNESYPFGFRRQFHARGEEVELLQRYLDGLEKEAAAVREAIAQLQQPAEAAPPAGDNAASAGGGETPPDAAKAP